MTTPAVTERGPLTALRAAWLPGLVDTHVHLAFDASADPVAALAARG